jgi:hypothetical protein
MLDLEGKTSCSSSSTHALRFTNAWPAGPSHPAGYYFQRTALADGPASASASASACICFYFCICICLPCISIYIDSVNSFQHQHICADIENRKRIPWLIEGWRCVTWFVKCTNQILDLLTLRQMFSSSTYALRLTSVPDLFSLKHDALVSEQKRRHPLEFLYGILAKLHASVFASLCRNVSFQSCKRQGGGELVKFFFCIDYSDWTLTG